MANESSAISIMLSSRIWSSTVCTFGDGASSFLTAFCTSVSSVEKNATCAKRGALALRRARLSALRDTRLNMFTLTCGVL